jgi:hypothetical protein
VHYLQCARSCCCWRSTHGYREATVSECVPTHYPLIVGLTPQLLRGHAVQGMALRAASTSWLRNRG